MNKILFILGSVIFLSGCSKVSHLQELLTMKSLSDNQALQEKYIEKQDEKFKELIEAIKNNRLEEYPNKESFLKIFGEPIFSKEVKRQEQDLDEWLYRYSAKLFGSEKVYVYFDKPGKLISWRYLEEPKKKENENKESFRAKEAKP